MKKILICAFLIGSIFSSCDQIDKNRYNTEQDGMENADDTGINKRDRNGNLPTSFDQSESESDRTITERIRQLIIRDGSLSNNAKNIKIITIKGFVTLRGPVNNEEEVKNIEGKIRQVSGVQNVDNQLEVVSKKS